MSVVSKVPTSGAIRFRISALGIFKICTYWHSCSVLDDILSFFHRKEGFDFPICSRSWGNINLFKMPSFPVDPQGRGSLK